MLDAYRSSEKAAIMGRASGGIGFPMRVTMLAMWLSPAERAVSYGPWILCRHGSISHAWPCTLATGSGYEGDMRIIPLLFALCLSVSSVVAQDRYQDDTQRQRAPLQPSLPETRQGETARSVAGQTGQRQSRELLSQDAGIEPMARINGRIQNRVQSRIRNRIDRYYDPQANAASPFEVAGDQARTAGRPRR